MRYPSRSSLLSPKRPNEPEVAFEDLFEAPEVPKTIWLFAMLCIFAFTSLHLVFEVIIQCVLRIWTRLTWLKSVMFVWFVSLNP